MLIYVKLEHTSLRPPLQRGAGGPVLGPGEHHLGHVHPRPANQQTGNNESHLPVNLYGL